MGLFGAILGNVAGQAIGSIFGKHNAKAQASIQQDSWQYMQSHKHQLEVEDLRKAGLNPILSAGNGSAVSAPSVATSSSDNGLGQAAAQAITAAKQLKIAQTEADSNRISAEAQKMQAETAKTLAESQSALWSTQQGYYTAITGKTFAETDKVRQDIANSIKLTDAQVEQLKSGTALNYSQIDKIVQDIQESISRSALNDMQKDAIRTDLYGWERTLRSLTAQQQYQYLIETLGSTQNQFGYGVRLMNPFNGGSVPFGSGRVNSYGG